MTEAQVVAEAPKEGSAAHFMVFLDWAEQRGEIAKATISNWRVASKNILEIEPGWEQIDLMDLDLEGFISRFETLNRTRYSTGSMAAYKSRFRSAVESYRLWKTKPGSTEWKPAPGKSPSSRPAKSGSRDSSKGAAQPTQQPPTQQPNGQSFVGMIEVPVPLRPGVKAKLILPEDLNKREAMRINAVVNGLAFDEQLALPPGRTNDEFGHE